MGEKTLNLAAIIISICAALFTGWQAYEARQARLDARQAQVDARTDSENAQKVQTKLAEKAAQEAKRSADAAEKSAEALLATTRTFEATSQLRLDPNIEVEASFQPFGNPPTAPRIVLWNTGAADAVAISVFLKSWVATTRTAGGLFSLISSGGAAPNWQLPSIAAGAIHVLELKEQAIEEPSYALQGKAVQRQPFLELVIQYLRPADRKQYEKRAYYFVSQNGRWVAENDPRSKTPINEQIKSHLKSNPPWKSDYRPGLDLTHDVKRQRPESGKTRLGKITAGGTEGLGLLR